jgi:hypothetical protein
MQGRLVAAGVAAPLRSLHGSSFTVTTTLSSARLHRTRHEEPRRGSSCHSRQRYDPVEAATRPLDVLRFLASGAGSEGVPGTGDRVIKRINPYAPDGVAGLVIGEGDTGGGEEAASEYLRPCRTCD